MTPPFRICIDARLFDGASGGVQQVVSGLAAGLSKLRDGDEEYLFLTYESADHWLRPYLDGNCHTLSNRDAPPNRRGWKRHVRKLRITQRTENALKLLISPELVPTPVSDGTIEKAGIDLMHFAHQSAFLTSVPSIYHPHDLQHIHLPHFFSRYDRRNRDIRYRKFCDEARMVAVASSWTKRDVERHFGLEDGKVRVVPWAPSTATYPIPSDHDIAATKEKFELPDRFVFYPAQTWAHKNHIGLIEAIAHLRDRGGPDVNFVSSGRRNEFAPQIERKAEQLGLADRVRFLGFVDPLELQCLFRLCNCVAIPTRFEAASAPLWEAFHAGAPAACSNVTSLPEQAGDAALVFDPDSVKEMAEAVRRLWTDEKLCAQLVERGRKRVAQFTWDRTARLFRAHYRRIGGRPMTEEDRALLSAPPLM